MPRIRSAAATSAPRPSRSSTSTTIRIAFARPVRRDGETNGRRSAGTRRSTSSRAASPTIQREHGANALGVYLGNPNAHHVGSILNGPALIRTLRTRNRFSATSVDQLPQHVACHAMYGHLFMFPIPDVDRTAYWLILGANPDRVERQHHDRARRGEAAEGDSRSRRQGRRDRSVPDRDGGRGDAPSLHPPRHRRRVPRSRCSTRCSSWARRASSATAIAWRDSMRAIAAMRPFGVERAAARDGNPRGGHSHHREGVSRRAVAPWRTDAWACARNRSARRASGSSSC